MSDVPGRCPACGAAVRVGAQWCTLCYADLRPKPAPVPTPAAPVPTQGTAEVAAGLPLTAAAAALAEALGDLAAPPRPPGESPVAAAQPAAPKVAARWPCFGCGTQNPLELMHCETCGRPFALEATTDVRAVKAERRRRLILAGAIAFGFVMLVLIVTILTTGDAPDPGTPVSDLPSPGVSAPLDGAQPVPVDPLPTEAPTDAFPSDAFPTDSPSADPPSESPTSIFQTP